MNDLGSTESLLRNFELPERTTSSVSTELLIHDNAISDSTDSLVNEHIQELLDRVHLAESPSVESQTSSNSEVSSRLKADISHHYKLENDPLEKRLPSLLSVEENIQTENNCVRRQYDPILSLLFNKVQVFLLRNRMSLDFLKIFKSYVEHLMESGLNPLEDRYLLELQNELSDGYEFSPLMENILNSFLLEPQNLLMKLSLFEHRMLLHTLRQNFNTWKLHHDMRKGLLRLEGVWNQYLQRKYISLWSRKYQYLNLNLMNQAFEFRDFTSVSLMYDKWFGNIAANNAKKGLADHFFLDHVFRKIKKRRRNMESLKFRADTNNRNRCMRNVFKILKLKHANSQFIVCQNNLKRDVMRRFKSKFDKLSMFKTQAEFTTEVFILGPYLKHWRKKTQFMMSHANQLVSLEVKFQKRRTFTSLKRIVERKKQEYELLEKLDYLLLQKTFEDFWRKRFQDRITLYHFWNSRNKQLTTSILKLWKRELIMNLQACQFNRISTVSNTFRVWCRLFKLQKYNNKKCNTITKMTFDSWLLKARHRKELQMFEKRTLPHKTFMQWRRNILEKSKALEFAIEHYEENVLKIFIAKWVGERKAILELDHRSLLYEKVRALMVVRRSFEHSQIVNDSAKRFEAAMVMRKVLPKYFLYWKEFSESKKIMKLEILLSDHQFHITSPISRKFFSLWHQKLVFYGSECYNISRLEYERNLGKMFILQARSKMEMRRKWSEISDGLRNKTLSIHMFSTWQVKLEILDNLKQTAEAEINKKNLLLLLSYLNIWSMKILKSKRNYETVQIFRKRWDRAGVRGLLLLWKDRTDILLKSLDRNDLEYDPESETEAQSIPLGSNLVTPVRAPPTNVNTIPGSEGVKQYRIEAMRSHYSKVRRAIPSPIKSSTILNSTVKKKFTREKNSPNLGPETLPPPRISLERINKRLAAKIDKINFESLPKVKLNPFTEPNDLSDPVIDRSLLETEEDGNFDESPTRRT